MANGPVIIRRTRTVEEADIIVAWLDDNGVPATVLDHENPGVFAFGITDAEGIAIMVADEELAERAKALLEAHDRERAAAAAEPQSTVEVTCEECNEVRTFPSNLRGTVQECPECGTFLDVPKGSE